MNQIKIIAKVVGTHAAINAGLVFGATVLYDLYKLAKAEARKN